MCATSMIYDYGRTNPPWEYPNRDHSAVPAILPGQEAKDAIKRFLKLLDAAKEYDDATRQRDCEDAEKAKFMKEVLDRLAAIEKRLQIQQ